MERTLRQVVVSKGGTRKTRLGTSVMTQILVHLVIHELTATTEQRLSNDTEKRVTMQTPTYEVK